MSGTLTLALRSVWNGKVKKQLAAAGKARAMIVLLLGLSIPLFVLLVALAWRSTLVIPIGYNEGWNAYWATAAVSGDTLYPSADSLRTNNYPPLSFFVVGAISAVTHDAVMAGRFVNWMAFLGIAILIAAILRVMGNSRIAAALGSIVFVAYMAIQFTDYVGIADPQMLAQAVMVAGLFILARRKSGAAPVVGAAVVMSVALFIKHSIIAVPLASAVWLLLYDRRAAALFVVTLGACGLTELALARIAFGRGFFANLFAPRVVSLRIGYDKLFKWLSPMQIPLGLSSVLAAGAIRDPGALLFAIYALVAFIVGAVMSMGEGVSVNSLFDLVVAFSLAIGHLFGRLEDMKSPSAFRLLVVGMVGSAFAFGAAERATADELRILPWVKAMRARAAATREVVSAISLRQGPALCAMPSICYWAGKPFEVDLFNYTEAASAKAHDESHLLHLIESRHFTSVQTMPDLVDGPSETYTLPYWRALGDGYRIVHADRVSNMELFVPK